MPFPYDQTFKLLGDDDPRAAIAAFAGIPLDAEMEVQSLDRELNLSTLRADSLYRCRQPGEEFLIHFEAVSRYRNEVLDWQVDHVRAIIAKYKLPCRSYLLLLTEGGVPERFPRYLEFRYGDYEARVRLRVVRLWKIPARRILAMGRLALFPWTALMAVTPAELAEAWRKLVATGDRSLPDQMILLSGLRYGKKEILEEVWTDMTMEELRESSWPQLVMDEGEKRGAHRLLTHLLTARFGELPQWAKERIAAAETDTLDRWNIRVLTALTLEDCIN